VLFQLSGVHAAAEAAGVPPPALLVEARAARACFKLLGDARGLLALGGRKGFVGDGGPRRLRLGLGLLLVTEGASDAELVRARGAGWGRGRGRGRGRDLRRGCADGQ
jgi:hypothetical protein